MQNKVAGYPDCAATAKAQAKRLSSSQGGKRNLSHAQALEMVANLHGVGTWAEMLAGFKDGYKGSSITGSKDYFRNYPEMIFSYFDYLNAAIRLNMKQDVFLQFTENAPIAFDSITKEDFLSTTQLLKLEDKILELFDLRSKSHGGQYSFGFGISQENFEMAKSGPSSIRQVGMTMLKDAGGIISGKEKCETAARLFFRNDGLTPKENFEFGLQGMEIKKTKARSVIKGGLPEINNRHSIMISSDPKKSIKSLMDGYEKGTIYDLFSKNTITDIHSQTITTSRDGDPRVFGEVHPQDKAINPVSIIARMPFWKSYGKMFGDIVFVSARDLSMADHQYLLTFMSRNSTHVIIVADMPEIPESVYRHVDHIWRP